MLPPLPGELMGETSILRREETTQFVLSPSASDHSGGGLGSIGERRGSDIALRKFLMHNPTFESSAEDVEVAVE